MLDFPTFDFPSKQILDAFPVIMTHKNLPASSLVFYNQTMKLTM